MMNLKDENINLKEKIEILKQQTELRSTALNLSKILIRVIDLQGKILYVNSAHTTHLGYTGDELLGTSSFDIMHPEDRERVMRLFFSSLSHPSMDGSVPVEYRMRHKNGDYLWARSIGRLAKAEGGQDLVVVTVWDITESKQIDDQLHALAERLHAIREEERARFSREIHDEFGQALTGLKFELALLAKKISQNNVAALKKARDMMQSIDETIHLIRRISTDLRPPILDDFGLKAAIEWHAEAFQKKHGIKTIFISNLSGELSIEKDKTISIYRIFQEALTNVARHAGASRVKICLNCDDNTLTMLIEDNGMGIAEDNVHDDGFMGIMEMNERAFALNGTFKIGAAPIRGTLIEFNMPLP